MPPNPGDDTTTITVKGEEDEDHSHSHSSHSVRHPSFNPSSPSPSPSPDSMSPVPPAGLPAAVHAASPRHLQSPDLEDDDHHRDNNNTTTTTAASAANLRRSSQSHNHNHNHNHNGPSSPPALSPAHHALRGTDTTSLPPPAPHHSNKRPRPNVMTTEERLLAMPEKRPMPWRPGVDAGADVETGGESRRKQIRFGCLLATRGDVVSAPCVSCANGRGKFSICVADPSLFRGACAGCQLSGRPNRCSIKQSDDAPSPNASTPESTSRNVKKKLNKAQQSPLMSKPDQRLPDQRLPDDAPTWHNGSPQWPQEYTVSQSHPKPDPSAAAAAAAAASQPRWATVNPPPPPPQPIQALPPLPSAPLAHHRPSNGVTILPPANTNPSPIPSRSPMGWATINAQQHRPPPPPANYSIEPATNGTKNHTHTNNSSGGGASFTHRNAREDTVGNDSNAGSVVAVIDTLPKNKQRQVYGVLSGLQAGIEHLQRELDALKRTLGVEDED